MKWNEVIGLVLVFLFLSTLFTYKSESTAQDKMSLYYWENYEADGTRVAWDSVLTIKFYNSTYDIKYQDSTITWSPYLVENDSTIYMYNTMFFDDSTISKVKGEILGENDMLVYPELDSLKLDTRYIYMKRKIPYQY